LPNELSLVDVTEANYASIPIPCRYCLYWQKTEPFTEDMARPEAGPEKLVWWRRTTSDFGTCHKIATVDGEPAGFIQYAPARYFPRVETFAPLVASPDALFIACLYLEKDWRGKGLGIAMVRQLVAELRRIGRPIETISEDGSTDNPSGPVDLYVKQGFNVIGTNKDWKLLRLKM
jgi:GNAT superfamily N-acetyltransferase